MRLHPYAPFGILIAITIGGVALTSTLKETHSSMKAKPATSSIVKVTPKPVVEVIQKATQFEAASGISTDKFYGGEILTKEANDTKFIIIGEKGSVEEVLIATAYVTHWNVHSCKPSGEHAYLGSLNPSREYKQSNELSTSLVAPISTNKYCHIAYSKDGAVSAVSITPNITEPNPIGAVSDDKRCRVLDTCTLYSVKTKWAKVSKKDFTLTKLELTVLRDLILSHTPYGSQKNSPWPTDIEAITKECNKGDESSCEYLKGYRLAYKAHQHVTIRSAT